MLKRLLLWLRVEAPPKRYYRCGTMWMRLSPEDQKLMSQRWREEDEQFIAWVEAHPRPKKEWVEQARRIRNRRVWALAELTSTGEPPGATWP